MKEFLRKFKYGNQNIAGGFDRFWLGGSLRISDDEEIKFLKRFYTNKLSVSKRSIEIVKKTLILEKQPNYVLSGKTGLQLGLSPSSVPKLSISVSPNLGWFAGYLEKNGDVYFFATNIESTTPPYLKTFQKGSEEGQDKHPYSRLCVQTPSEYGSASPGLSRLCADWFRAI